MNLSTKSHLDLCHTLSVTLKVWLRYRSKFCKFNEFWRISEISEKSKNFIIFYRSCLVLVKIKKIRTASNFICNTRNLLHVSWIFSSPEPKAHGWANSIPVTPTSIIRRPSVHDFRHLLLWNHLANWIQISIKTDGKYLVVLENFNGPWKVAGSFSDLQKWLGSPLVSIENWSPLLALENCWTVLYSPWKLGDSFSGPWKMLKSFICPHNCYPWKLPRGP